MELAFTENFPGAKILGIELFKRNRKTQICFIFPILHTRALNLKKIKLYIKKNKTR